MKLSISAPFKAAIEPTRRGVNAGRFSRWWGGAPVALPVPYASPYLPSRCRQALIDAIKLEQPRPDQLEALCRWTAKSIEDPEVTTIPIDSTQPVAEPTATATVTVTAISDKKPLLTQRRRSIRPPQQDLGGFPTDDNFAALASAYQASGGLVRAEDLVRLAELAEGPDRCTLISAITSGHILSFQWRQSYWVPIFQFETGGMDRKTCAQQAILALTNTFDDWEKVVWFVQPNLWLDGAKPLDLLAQQLPEVLNAARADRYVAAG